MALKFNRTERKELDAHTAKLKKLREEIFAKIQEYNDEVDNFTNTRDEAADRVQGEYDDKSERWQEGERGQAVAEWLEEVRQVEVTRLDEAGEVEAAEGELDALEAMNYGPVEE